MNFMLCVMYHSCISFYLKRIVGQRPHGLMEAKGTDCFKNEGSIELGEGRSNVRNETLVGFMDVGSWLKQQCLEDVAVESKVRWKQVTLCSSLSRNQLDAGDCQSDPHQGGSQLGQDCFELETFTMDRNPGRASSHKESERPTLLQLPPPYSTLPQVILPVQGQGELHTQRRLDHFPGCPECLSVRDMVNM